LRLVTADEMRALEGLAFNSGTSEAALMEAAGAAVAHAAARWLGNGRGKRLLTLAGKGHNGGDAIIASRVLAQEHGLRPTLYLLAGRDADPLLD
jgi:ADP-dependent NAD(P)H-hydrate dehydratase / NAD(P)H-hydrate epimerase